MNVLFVASGNSGKVSPIVKNQMEALVSNEIEVDIFLIKGKGVLGYLRNIYPLKSIIRSHKYDVIHAHYSLSAFVASLAGAKPLIVSLMGSDVKASRIYKHVIRLCSRFFNWRYIIVKSLDMYNQLGISDAKILPNGVDTAKFTPMNKSQCQNRLGWNPEVKHVLFPANPNRAEKDYALAAAAVNLLGGVELHYFDNIPHEETLYWYNAADAILLTSLWEGSPNAIKEAMACSRPIVSTDVGDVHERVNGLKGCRVVYSRNPSEIAIAISEVVNCSSTDGRIRITDDGLENKQITDRLIQIYHSCL